MGTASGRNKEGNERDPHDYYPTPPWCVHRLLEKIDLNANGVWLEPAAGNGALVKATNNWFDTTGKPTPATWITNEIRQEESADYHRDFTALSTLKLFQEKEIDVFITNPPFALADIFLEHALRLRNASGEPPIIVMLLRLQWMATRGRAALMQQHTPTLAVLPDRPNFTTTGNGDMCEYAWHIWEHPKHKASTIMLNTTEVRQRRGLHKNIYVPLFETPKESLSLFG